MSNGTNPAGDLQASRLERAVADLRRTVEVENTRLLSKARWGTILRLAFIVFFVGYMQLLVIPFAAVFTDVAEGEKFTVCTWMLGKLDERQGDIVGTLSDTITEELKRLKRDGSQMVRDKLREIRENAQGEIIERVDTVLKDYREVLDSFFGEQWAEVEKTVRDDERYRDAKPGDRGAMLVNDFMDHFKEVAIGHSEQVYEEYDVELKRIEGLVAKFQNPKISERDRLMRDIVGYTILVIRDLGLEDYIPTTPDQFTPEQMELFQRENPEEGLDGEVRR
ncbi:MAG: hypothetical protein AAB215_05675 [Planctomycetota bacterium]